MPTSIQRPPNLIHKAGSSIVRLLPVAASQTIKKGDLLVFSAGYVQQAASASANVGAVSNSVNILVIADQDSPSTAALGTLISCQLVDDDTILRFPLSANDAVLAFTQASHAGFAFELRNVGGIYTVNASATTNVKVRVIDIDPNTPSPKGSGYDDWVLVRPIPGQWL
jgi:hypothetical protein